MFVWGITKNLQTHTYKFKIWMVHTVGEILVTTRKNELKSETIMKPKLKKVNNIARKGTALY